VDGFAPSFMGMFLGEKERPSVSLRLVKGCGSNGRKLRKTAIVYKIVSSGNSELVGRIIVGVAIIADKKSLSWGFVLSQSTFHLV